MSRIVLVDGPQDGREIDVARAALEPRYRLPRYVAAASIVELEQGIPTSSFEVDEYVLGVRDGGPSLDGRGRIRYLYVRTERP